MGGMVEMLMNILFLPTAITFLLVIMPPLLLFKIISFTIRSLHPEDLAGKVVVITGASSGIGECLAYSYAKRGARLVLAARREDRLREVSDKARSLGSPEVMVVPTDVSDIDQCKRLVDETVNKFGQLDHLVNNAGIVDSRTFEESNVQDLMPVMNINFWGSVYTTRAAIPYLKKSKGKIIVIASCAAWICVPKGSFYSASKAAQIIFFESLRIEIGSDIGITIVTPGFVESEMTSFENLSKIAMTSVPMASTEGCAEAIVRSASRGDEYLTHPTWPRVGFLYKVLCPEVLVWLARFLTSPKASILKLD